MAAARIAPSRQAPPAVGSMASLTAHLRLLVGPSTTPAPLVGEDPRTPPVRDVDGSQRAMGDGRAAGRSSGRPGGAPQLNPASRRGSCRGAHPPAAGAIATPPPGRPAPGPPGPP